MTVPVSFEYEGIQFDGYFTNDIGVGFNYYALKLNGVDYGLLIRKDNGWKWASGPMRLFEESFMLNYFAAIVEAEERKESQKISYYT